MFVKGEWGNLLECRSGRTRTVLPAARRLLALRRVLAERGCPAIARGMFGHRQLSSVPQFPAFTISAAGQEVWEGDIIELNQLLLLDTLRELKAIAPFFLLCKSLQNKPGYVCRVITRRMIAVFKAPKVHFHEKKKKTVLKASQAKEQCA